MMYGRGKSSPVIVAGKPANKAQPDSVTAVESVERRAGAKGNANRHPRTGLSAGSRVVFALASIRQAAMLDCQYPRWEPYAGKLHVRVCAGGARQLAFLPRRKHQFLIVSAALLAAPAASAQVGNAPFCLATDSTFGGEPDCSYRTWAQCRASQPGAGAVHHTKT